MALTDKLSAIGNAIREKSGKADLLTLDQMPQEIRNIETGGPAPVIEELSITANGTYNTPEGVDGYNPVVVNVASTGGDIPEEAFIFTGDCKYKFQNDGWDWFIKSYGNRITTNDISNCDYMFNRSNNLTEALFEINMSQNIGSLAYIFNYCQNLITPAKINLSLVTPKYGDIDFSYMFNNCNKVRNLDNVFVAEDLDPLATIKITSSYSTPNYNNIFSSCYSLRTVPKWFYKLRVNEESTTYPSYLYTIYYTTFQDNYALDEITNLPVVRVNSNQTTNMFNNTFTRCYRLKNVTFETDNGTPYVVNWKSQTIDLSTIGIANIHNYITDFNSGITIDKQVKDEGTYQALKNDPDWFTTKKEYSRYNHDSAVETINSLPDTSAYLASAGGTNTIKFTGAAGSLTDGGAINTLTEEEIAVAVAKGWTVSFV